jgi:hypothetical protein
MTLVAASLSLGRDAEGEAASSRSVTVVVAISRSRPGPAQHLGGYEGMQYGRTAMQANRQQQATRVLLVLAVLLASVWTAGVAAPAAGLSTIHLTGSHPLPGIEPAILRDRLPVLRPPVERPGPSGRLVPVLVGMLVAALAVAYGCAGQSRSDLAPTRSLVRSTPRGARAPPPLKPA